MDTRRGVCDRRQRAARLTEHDHHARHQLVVAHPLVPRGAGRAHGVEDLVAAATTKQSSAGRALGWDLQGWESSKKLATLKRPRWARGGEEEQQGMAW